MYATVLVAVYWVSVLVLFVNIASARSFGDMVVAIPETAASVALLIAAIPLAAYAWLALATGIAIRPWVRTTEQILSFTMYWGVV